jgi:uncharacterized membrane protein YesL
MNYRGLTGIFIRASEWVMRLGTLTMLWFSFSIVGLIVFGLMPATAAMFSVLRKWTKGEEDFSTFRFFIEVYKKEFLKLNLLGLVLLIAGIVLFVDWRFFSVSSNPVIHITSYFILCLTFIYFITLLYLFPVFAHYEYKTMNYIKNSFIIAIMNPITTLTMVGICVIVYYISKYLPLIVILFCISAFAYAISYTANKAFQKLEKKQQLLPNKNI